MKDELVTLGTAKLAKEKEFNIPTINYFFDKEYYLQPTQSLLARWVREKHRICIQIHPLIGNKYEWRLFFLQKPLEGGEGFENKFLDNTGALKEYDSFEEAMEKALFEALTIIWQST